MKTYELYREVNDAFMYAYIPDCTCSVCGKDIAYKIDNYNKDPKVENTTFKGIPDIGPKTKYTFDSVWSTGQLPYIFKVYKEEKNAVNYFMFFDLVITVYTEKEVCLDCFHVASLLMPELIEEVLGEEQKLPF